MTRQKARARMPDLTEELLREASDLLFKWRVYYAADLVPEDEVVRDLWTFFCAHGQKSLRKTSQDRK